MIYLVIYTGLDNTVYVEKAFHLYTEAFEYVTSKGWHSEIHSYSIDEVEIQ